MANAKKPLPKKKLNSPGANGKCKKKPLPQKKLNSPGASGWEAAPFCLHDSVLKQAEQEAKPMQSGSFAELRRSADA